MDTLSFIPNKEIQTMAKAPDTKPEVGDNEPVADPNAGLVHMIKEGVSSFVHRTCVAAHQKVGWVLAQL